MLEQPATGSRGLAAEQVVELRQQGAIQQRAPEDVAEATHHVRGRDVRQPERHEQDGTDPRSAHHHAETLQGLEEVERDEAVGGGVADRPDRGRGGRVGGGFDEAQRPAAQRVALALGAVAQQLHRLGHRAVERGLGEGDRIEHQLGAQRCREVAEHRAADHAGQDLNRSFAAVTVLAPPPVEDREPRLVARRQRHAVQQLSPLHALGLPRLLHLDDHAVAQRRVLGSGEREEVRLGLGDGGGLRRVREHNQPLEIDDVRRHRLAGRGRGGRRGGRERGGALDVLVGDRGDVQLGQPARRHEIGRLVAQQRRVDLDRLLAAQPDPQPQPWARPARQLHHTVRVAREVGERIAGLVEDGHGHARRGLARVLLYDPEHPEVFGGHGGPQYVKPEAVGQIEAGVSLRSRRGCGPPPSPGTSLCRPP